MTEDFELIAHGEDELTVRLPKHGLNGEAKDLFDLVASEIRTGRWRSITLDGSEAAFVTMAGIVVLITLRRMGDRSEVVVAVSSPHPNLRQRLTRTGIIDELVAHDG
jgi:anti-anti-sigma regulatory factor